MPTLRYVLVDVFTDCPLAGNPLAVFTDARGLTQDTMQALARELNLSETTFVLPAKSGGTARVRIFSPRAEIPFAGHPTLGTALVIGGPLGARTVTLELDVGHVPVVLDRESGRAVGGWFSRPAPPPVAFDHTDELLLALGLERTASPVVVYDNGMRHAVVHLANHAEVASLQPNLNLVARIPADTVDVFAFDGTVALLRVLLPRTVSPRILRLARQQRRCSSTWWNTRASTPGRRFRSAREGISSARLESRCVNRSAQQARHR